MKRKALKLQLKKARAETRVLKAAVKAPANKLTVVDGGKKGLRVRPEILARAKAANVRPKLDRPAQATDRFALHRPPPGVVPKDFSSQIAMDSDIDAALTWAAQSPYAGAWSEGLVFLGYAYLSELAQRPEYRVISSVIVSMWLGRCMRCLGG